MRRLPRKCSLFNSSTILTFNQIYQFLFNGEITYLENETLNLFACYGWDKQITPDNNILIKGTFNSHWATEFVKLQTRPGGVYLEEALLNGKYSYWFYIVKGRISVHMFNFIFTKYFVSCVYNKPKDNNNINC